ncbi:MAG TPA: hypothetical protein VHQ24_14295 [Lachnospiraceae bacterium]|nr:hypothetical protein [Lachnospiraceae bacterium]
MGNEIGYGDIKYCPNCRNVMDYEGRGNYRCLVCYAQVIMLNEDTTMFYEIIGKSSKIPESEANIEPTDIGSVIEVSVTKEVDKDINSNQDKINESKTSKVSDSNEPVLRADSESKRTCLLCGKAIQHGTYCKECTFLQIQKMQKQDIRRPR